MERCANRAAMACIVIAWFVVNIFAIGIARKADESVRTVLRTWGYKHEALVVERWSSLGVYTRHVPEDFFTGLSVLELNYIAVNVLGCADLDGDAAAIGTQAICLLVGGAWNNCVHWTFVLIYRPQVESSTHSVDYSHISKAGCWTVLLNGFRGYNGEQGQDEENELGEGHHSGLRYNKWWFMFKIELLCHYWRGSIWRRAALDGSVQHFYISFRCQATLVCELSSIFPGQAPVNIDIQASETILSYMLPWHFTSGRRDTFSGIQNGILGLVHRNLDAISFT